jgi:hypothetical protein
VGAPRNCSASEILLDGSLGLAEVMARGRGT